MCGLVEAGWRSHSLNGEALTVETFSGGKPPTPPPHKSGFAARLRAKM